MPFINMRNGVRGVTVNSDTNTVSLSIYNALNNYVYVNEIDAFLGGAIVNYSEYGSHSVVTSVTAINSSLNFCNNDATLYEDYIEYNNGYWGGYFDFIVNANQIIR